jgi:hypothetical protein
MIYNTKMRFFYYGDGLSPIVGSEAKDVNTSSSLAWAKALLTLGVLYGIILFGLFLMIAYG